ncbi:hypothetical protein J2T19_001967 [Paenibacillus tundrae]|uniref:HTH psq-type domain-containing protein n=1 Tax=Paenibacillus tundrae TaxID=528187 RepID=A0ABT9WBN1_9BACL|nr:hypothetical protein [Paenibacillus tundrae]
MHPADRSIGEAAAHFGLPESTLRYDEKKAAASSHAGRGFRQPIHLPKASSSLNVTSGLDEHKYPETHC